MLQSYQMQVENQTLLTQVSMNQEKHKIAYNRIQSVIDRMIQLYQQAEQNIRTGKDHEKVITELNQQLLSMRPLKTVREHFIHYYRKLSTLIRRFQNGNKMNNTALSRYSKRKESNGNAKEIEKNQKFQKFFSNFITEQQQKQCLQRMIVDHFFREGNFECADIWKNDMDEVQLSSVFKDCHKVKDRIRKGFFEQAINWCQSEKMYFTRGCLLEYELIKTKIISLVNSGKAKQALEYYIKKITKFATSCREQIDELMGFILFSSQNYWSTSLDDYDQLKSFIDQRYSKFVSNDEKLKELSQFFFRQYLKQNKINQFDVLKIVYNCSIKISEEYQRLMHLTWQSESKTQQKKKYQKQLPFSIKLDNSDQYHSLFLCPITKQVHTSGDTSALLSCGHMISHTAQEKIVLESRNRRRVKCPICLKDILPQDSIQVDF